MFRAAIALLGAVAAATVEEPRAEPQTGGRLARYRIKIFCFLCTYLSPPQPWKMRAYYNTVVCQHRLQPDHLAEPAGAQQAGAGGDGGAPVLPPGQGPVLSPPADLPLLRLRPCLHNPREPSPTMLLSMFGSPGCLRGADEQVWVQMASKPCLSQISRGWRPQHTVRRGD